LAPGANFSYIFSGENFRENSAENFPPKNVGKNGIFRRKSFEKLFFQEIPRNFPRKKNYDKLAPRCNPLVSFSVAGINPVNYESRLKESWVWKELHAVRNVKPGQEKLVALNPSIRTKFSNPIGSFYLPLSI
jgi:hypothetical protein